jgi:hypothetical protein
MMFGIRCKRSGYSQFGPALSWAKRNNEVLLFNTFEEAEQEAIKIKEYMSSPNLSYWAEEYI